VSNGLILLAVGVFAGVLVGFLGIGGGTVMVPVMVALGLSGVEAVGTSTLAILVISLGGSPHPLGLGELLTNPVFEPSPALLNAVEVRRVGWQVNDLCPSGFNQLSNPTAVVKGRIVENHPITWPQHRNQAGLKPGLKDRSVTRPFHCKRSNELMPSIPS
jgi:hypothetical protein